MLVKVDPSSLRRTKWYEYAIRFVLGGLITVAAGAIAKKWGPGVGGLFLAFPAIFPASATLIEKHEQQRKEHKGLNGTERGKDAAALDASGAALGSIALALFATAIWWFLPRLESGLVLACAAVVWLAASVGLWMIRKR